MGEPNADPSRPDGADELFLLFAFGQRPSIDAALQAVAKLDSVERAQVPGQLAGAGLLEVQTGGLIFDLVGLAPGPRVAMPDLYSKIAMPQEIAATRMEALVVRAGPHIVEGRHTSPIMRPWLSLAADIAHALGAQAAGWGPAGVAMGLGRLREAASATNKTLPPELFVSFRKTLDGAFSSEGLSFFTGQEMRIEPTLVESEAQAKRLGNVLFADLHYGGGLTEPRSMTGPDGRTLLLEPSANGRMIRIWPG